ncbi:sugar phosphate isomerase/epimerase [Mycolicibacterium sp. P1-18]|uniref:sugar phosphate isomerase/epimerase family protein n=1 Tax=Mycolicibacterium sp. P1-18 TaxID=2024615 RepID=UPI0011F1EF92|nr:sugar phosphate isomerase/epimerase family protein [Mycolicibacterium sp. P1-18]KAA0102384.1 sugar phosphate isomerase/epimerase [Mycolicibacterium sp. P1-18]
MDLAECSLNSITARSAGLDDLVGLAAAHGFGGVGLWRDVLVGVDLTAASARIADAGLRVTSVCRGGMFPQPDEPSRRRTFDDNREAVDQTNALRADCLVLVCGPSHSTLADARAQVRDGIAALAPYARDAGVRLAIEPFHPMLAASRSVVTSIGEANALVEALDDDVVGLAVDAYHLWWDAALTEQIRRAGSSISCVQLADWVTPIQGELSSRGMPGEGCIDMAAFVAECRAAGYRGLVEVEVLSDDWWAEPAAVSVRAAAAGLAAL